MNLAEKLVMRLIGALVPYASNSTGQDIFRAALMDYWDARPAAHCRTLSQKQ